MPDLILVSAAKPNGSKPGLTRSLARSTFKTIGVRAIAFTCLSVMLLACRSSRPVMHPRILEVQQNWELEPGQVVAGHRISGGLGDISIEVSGNALYAPFTGIAQPYQANCIVFSSPEVPAYLLRLCGVRRPTLGEVQRGDKLGTGKIVHFAALRKQPTGQWAIVEPASDILERVLAKPPSNTKSSWQNPK